MKNVIVIGIALVLLSATSCYYDSKEDLYQFIDTSCDTSAVTYSEDISAILNTNCVSCHNTSLPNGNLDLSTYNGTKVGMDNGTILERINKPSGDPLLMPQGGKLDECSIQKITIWSNAGSPNN